ncbi:nucleotidyltransferase domain-containing protein [Candidatus Woesearchaeota archaeon]|nr:nucleotidyltransferase domain-containing protein [Candidatus Woesearchaeota archaeon]
MVKEGFLDLQRLGKLWRIKANQSHPYFVSEKIPYHLNLVYKSGIVEAVKTRFNPLAIVLFGSYRKGDDTRESDLDIAVEVIGNKPLEIVELTTIKQFGYREDVKVNLHVFSRNRIDLNVFANIANGIILDGFLEARP